ncbi:hypothetical protein BQ8482_340087 [Mesorhizobium delmotii]|uniref:Uncharacterized protein n=1 Tax=Mesorhizobium delmotii TaxID=1631247 RepID=A0A2P9APV2_9HYPH|nr:hypothetical protein BQ8482_340087 [Mesorhizobium delmotii]
MHVALMQFSRKRPQRQRKTAWRDQAVDWSSESIGSEQGSGVLDLLDCLRHQIVHGAANLMVRLDDPGFVEILADLAENVVIAGFLDVGEDYLASIGFGVGPGLAELFGGPQAERLVAAGRGLEPEFLVDYEFALEALLAIFHAAHGIPPVNPIRWQLKYVYCRSTNQKAAGRSIWYVTCCAAAFHSGKR